MPEANSVGTLSVLVAHEDAAEDDIKGIFSRPSADQLVRKEIPVDQLQQQMKSLTENIALMSGAAQDTEPSGLRLRELTVQVEITANGGVNLIGAAATVGATAGMTLTFSRD